MWSKAGRFVECVHIVGEIITKISVNCVINLHATLLFTCVFLWVTICVLISVFTFMGIAGIYCMYTFTVILV